MLYLYHVNTFVYHDLTDQLLIGRTFGQLVFSSDSKMSGKHAQITVSGNGAMIEDLGSKNLTVVNRTQIPPLQKINLKLMSLLEVGSQQFILTDNNKMSLEQLNHVMDLHLKKPIVKREVEKTAPNIIYAKTPLIPKEPDFEDPIVTKEKRYLALEKELADLELELKNSYAKKSELIKAMGVLKHEVNEAKALKIEMENKKKKIINLKDFGD